MTTKTFIVDYELERKVSYYNEEERIEIEVNDNLSDKEIEKEIKDAISDLIENDDCDLGSETININDLKEVPILDQIRSTECLKCEVFNNVCKKCVYYINDKCKGK